MLSKNNIYILLSIFLGFIISFYYNRIFDESFILIFILTALIFYIIFYYLADIKNKENFMNYTVRDYLEDIIEDGKNMNNNMIQEEDINISNNLGQENSVTTIPIEKACGPLNININYYTDNKPPTSAATTAATTSATTAASTAASSYPIEDTSNNSIYGNYAWTNNPDYYIPTKVPQPLNQLINTRNNKDNMVSPIIINTPWSEYRSGDSDLEPYNL